MKHRMSLILGLGLFVIGCGDDGGTAEGGSGSSSGTEGNTTSTTMPTTMQPTTEPMTSAATTTTGGPDDTSTTASVDSTGSEGSSGGSSGSTGPAESSSSGEPPGDPAYPPCMVDADPVCADPYDHCYTGLMPGSGFSVCSVMCMDDAECPQPESGDAPAVCAGPNDDECADMDGVPEPYADAMRSWRDGCWLMPPNSGRSAARHRFTPATRGAMLGVRVGRPLDKKLP